MTGKKDLFEGPSSPFFSFLPTGRKHPGGRVISLSFSTQSRCELRDITSVLRSLAARWSEELHRHDGALLLFSPHTTCGLTINEGADPDVRRDMLGFMERLVPQYPERSGAPAFAHAEENSDAHIKTSLFGPQLLIPVSGGHLCLGRWQAVYLCEADGPRQRTLWVQWLHGEADA